MTEAWKIDQALRQKCAAARRLTPFVFQLVDLKAEARKYCRVLGISVPSMKIRHGAGYGVSGRAWTRSRRIVLTIGYNCDVHSVLEVLLHELVHVASTHHHNDQFCALLVRTARTLWGVQVDGWTRAQAVDGKRAYGIDELIRAELKVKLEEGQITPCQVRIKAPRTAQEPAPAPVVSLVERRQARALKNLERAQADMRKVQKRLSKWKDKVRYYERRAAASKKV
jgi:hypothetical protein